MFDNVNIGIADFQNSNYAEVLYWHATKITGQVFVRDTVMELAQAINLTNGPMKPLPEWISKGCIIGIVQSTAH